MFGSFATGEGDRFSDIEFILFFKDESFPNIDQEHWAVQIETLELYFADDYGHHTAIFTNLVRVSFISNRHQEFRLSKHGKDMPGSLL